MTNDSRKTALHLMMDLMPSIREVVDAISLHDRNLAEQLRKSASSVVLNHSEADGNRGGNRRIRIEQAYGSLHEVRTTLKLAAAWGYVPRAKVERIDRRPDEVGALSWRRLHASR